jgi:hypothetical protein
VEDDKEDDKTLYFELFLSDLEDVTNPTKEKFDRRAMQDSIENAFSAVEHTKLLDLLEDKKLIDRRDRDALRENVFKTVDQMLKTSAEKRLAENPDSTTAKYFLKGLEEAEKEYYKEHPLHLTRMWHLRRG